MLTLVFTLLCGAPADAQTMPNLQAKLDPFKVQTQAYVLPSGLRVIMQEDDATPLVTVATIVGAGRMHDPKGKSELSHMVEHLSYQADVNGHTAASWLESLGARYDGSTAIERTAFLATAPADSLGTLLAISGQRLIDPLNGVTEADLAAQMDVMDLERNYYRSDVISVATPALIQGLFPEDHPWAGASTPFFTEHRNLTMDDVQSFADEYYRPENATLVIVGDIDFESATQTLMANMPVKAVHPKATEENRESFLKPDIVDADPENPDHLMQWIIDPDTKSGVKLEQRDFQRASGGRGNPPEPTWNLDETIVVEGMVDRPWAVVGWSVPGLYQGQDATPSMAALAMWSVAGGAWAQNFQVDSAQCGAAPGVETSFIYCMARAQNPFMDPEVLINTLLSASAMFWNPDMLLRNELLVSNGQREAVRDQLLLLNLTSSMFGRTTQLGFHAHFDDNLAFASGVMNQAMTANHFDTMNYVKQWLTAERAARVIVMPRDMSERVQVQSPRTYHGGLLAPETIPEEEAPSVQFTPFPTDDIETLTLDNGLRVVMRPSDSIPVAQVAVMARGGTLYRNGLDAYLNQITFNLLNDIGTSADKRNLAPRNIAGNIVGYQNPGYSGQILTASSGNLPGALYLMRRNMDALKINPVMRPQLYLQARQDYAALFQQRTFWANYERLRRAMPNHPYSYVPLWEDVTNWKKAGADELLTMLRQKYSPDNSVLVVSGSFDTETALRDVKEYFNTWKGPDKGTYAIPDATFDTPQSGVVVLEDPTLAYTVISATCGLDNANAERRPQQELLGPVLDDLLNTKLGDTTALAQSVTTTVPGPVGMLNAVLVVPNEDALAGVKALQDSFAGLASGEIDGSALAKAKREGVGRYMARHQILDEITISLAEGTLDPTLGFDWQDVYGQGLESASAADLQGVGGHCAEQAVYTVETPSAADVASLGGDAFDWVAAGDAQLMVANKRVYKQRVKARAKK